jgi:hypothetical protein
MPTNFLKRRNILKSANALDLVPVTSVKYELTENNLVKLIVPRFQNKLLEKIFVGRKLKPEFKVTLDETGSLAWLAIDGLRNIEAIIEVIKTNFESKEIKLNDAENRTLAFITRLYQEEYIIFSQLQ